MLYLSYTREDALLAVQLSKDLSEMGIETWLDLAEIGPGADWATAQHAAIEACEGMIAVLSPEALQREHMRHEINQAFDAQKPVYLAVGRRCAWQEWMRHLPYADFTQDYEAGFNTLVLSIIGGKKRGDTDDILDPAEAFLQAAEQGKLPPSLDEEHNNTGKDGWLKRTVRKLF